MLWSGLQLVGSETLIVPYFVFYGLFRTFVFTFAFAYLSDTMGFRYFGMLSGMMFLLCGLVGFLMYPLVHWAHRDSPENASHRWYLMNLVRFILFIFSYGFCIQDYLDRKKKSMQISLLDSGDEGSVKDYSSIKISN